MNNKRLMNFITYIFCPMGVLSEDKIHTGKRMCTLYITNKKNYPEYIKSFYKFIRKIKKLEK